MTRRRERRGTAAQWASANPILGAGEWGILLDGDDGQPKAKVGDGVRTWSDLAFVGDEGGDELPEGVVTLDNTGAIGAAGDINSVLLVDSGDDTPKRIAVTGGEVTLDGQPIGGDELPEGVVIRDEDGWVEVKGTTTFTVNQNNQIIGSTDSGGLRLTHDVDPNGYTGTIYPSDFDWRISSDGSSLVIEQIGVGGEDDGVLKAVARFNAGYDDDMGALQLEGDLSVPRLFVNGTMLGLYGQNVAPSPALAGQFGLTPGTVYRRYGLTGVAEWVLGYNGVTSVWIPRTLASGHLATDAIQDTGWRKINLSGPYPNLDANSRYLIRRIGNQVHHDVNIYEPDGAGYGAWYSNILPVGFRDDVEGAFFAGRHQANGTNARSVSLWSTYGADAGMDGMSSGRFIGSGVTTTRDVWPTVLPGTAYPPQ